MKALEIIDEAISERKTISFEYGGLVRVVEPHHYGKLGEFDQVHCYQVGGDSNSGGLPEWRNFKVDEMKNVAKNDKVFTPESTYRPKNSNYKTIIKKVAG